MESDEASRLAEKLDKSKLLQPEEAGKEEGCEDDKSPPDLPTILSLENKSANRGHPPSGDPTGADTQAKARGNLKPITLSDLKLDQTHVGAVLHGRLCVRPFKLEPITTILEDEKGSRSRFQIYNAVSPSTTREDIEGRYPSGAKVAVKEPFFTIGKDGRNSVQVRNPSDIEFLPDEPQKEGFKILTGLKGTPEATCTLAHSEEVNPEQEILQELVNLSLQPRPRKRRWRSI